jgi:dihydrofolate synthase / folylpolyglutamate synthase
MAARAGELEALLQRLSALHPRVIDLSLGRIERLLAALGHPERRLPPVVHFAGTNGKGSTLAFCRAALAAAGYRVHAYTSPHLVRFNERIVLADAEISDVAAMDLLGRAEAANVGQPITEFEIITAAAFLGFAETKADWLLLEVGLGGRLDATNVVARPAACCITPVDLDHREFLGDTIAKIAAEKAGILKPGVKAAIAQQVPEAAAVIAARAAELGAPLSIQNRDWTVSLAGDGMRYEGARWRLDLPRPGLVGMHQIQNAGTALATLELLAADSAVAARLGPAALAAGIAGARWPARLQRLTKGPIAALVPPGVELWLDGGHNPHGARAIAAWLRARGLPAHLVVGMKNTKDAGAFLAAFIGAARSVQAVANPGDANALPPAVLAALAAERGLPALPRPGLAAAVAAAARQSEAPAIVLIAGSLYLAGTVLAENG